MAPLIVQILTTFVARAFTNWRDAARRLRYWTFVLGMRDRRHKARKPMVALGCSGSSVVLPGELLERVMSGSATVIIGILLAGIAAGQAQQPTEPTGAPAKALSFEVVSIKRSPPGAAPGRAGLLPGGRYVLSNGPIRVLIGIAFPSPTNEIIDAPDWVTNENYDITGLAGPAATFPQVAEMLKTMLADRMQLVAHYEVRERAVYELVLASSDGRLGPGLRQSAVDCVAVEAAARARNEIPQPPPPTGPVPQCTLRRAQGLMEANAWSMTGLAENLRNSAGRAVIDRTGLTGAYDLKLEWAPDPATNADARPSLFTALQEQLGLKLQPSTAPLPVLVIDRIERPIPD